MDIPSKSIAVLPFVNISNEIDNEYFCDGITEEIMPGVAIGDGAIIASKSVVTKIVESYAIVGGNPAIIIQKRFSNDNIDDLLNLKGWNWGFEKVSANVQTLTGNDIDCLNK